MTSEKYHRLRKILTAWLILLVIQLACGSVAPTDPRIPESINYMAWNFGPWLEGIGIIPLSPATPPVITNISSESVSGLGSIGTGSASTEPAVKIHLYQIEMKGCRAEPVRGKLLAETTVDFGGTWSISQIFEPGVIVGATQVLNGNESGLSNLRVNLNTDELLVVNDEDEIQQIEHDISQKFVIAGSSFPGACIVLLSQNMDIGRVGSVSVPSSGEQQGRWSIEIPLQEGENRYRVYIEGWDEIKKEYVVRGFFPHMQWPYTIKDINEDKTCRYSAREAYVTNCYYLAPITTWFGPNDFYQLKNLGGGTGFHDGIDIGGEKGVPVHVVAKGKVFYVQISNSNGGYVVLVDHGAWFSVYMHLSKITICARGKTENCNTPTKSTYYDTPTEVEAGDIIGEIGNTGCGDCGAHLHFSSFFWKNGNRDKSLGENRTPAWPWSPYGVAINVNPPKDTMLGNGENSNNRLADRRNPNQLEEYFSNSNYWQINWQEVRIKEYGCASGTKFDELVSETIVVNGREQEKLVCPE